MNNKKQQTKLDWSAFDFICCIHYLPYADRLEQCKKSLARIGILGLKQFQFEYTVPNKYYEVLLDENKFEDQIDRKRIKPRNLNLQINRLNLFKKMYYLGYDRILLLEDDSLYYKDLSIIAEYINDLPLDYDIVNFDYWFLDKDEFWSLLKDKSKQINNHFVDSSCVQKMWNMSFVSVNRKGIKYLIDSQEKMFRPMDNYIAYKSENYELAKDIKFAISKMNLSMQKLYPDRQNCKTDNKYDGQGLIYSNYC